MLKRGAFGRNGACNVVVGLCAGEKSPGAGVVHYISDLFGAAGGVDRHRHGAVAVAGEVGDQYLAAVGRKNGYIVLWLDSENLEGAGGLPDAVGQFSPGAGVQCACCGVYGGQSHPFTAVTPCLPLDYVCENIGH